MLLVIVILMPLLFILMSQRPLILFLTICCCQNLKKFYFDRNFLELFNSYLFGRYQSVRINQSISSALPVTSGVPQGSVLGPLLFLCFINDIGDGIQDSQFRLFADDLKVFKNFNVQSVQADIDSLSEWSELNNLDFHPKKCKLSILVAKTNPTN